MQINARPWEVAPIIDVGDPATMANTEKTTTGVATGQYHGYRYVLLLGNMASETIDFRVEVADDSGFSTNKVTLKAATQLAAHATNNDSKQIEIFVTGIDIEKASPTARYIRARGITGNATGGPVAMLGIGVGARYAPVTALATVLQQVTV